MGGAQPSTITVDSQRTTDELLQWLDWGSPQFTAWAAYFANRSGDQDVLNQLVLRVEHWEAPAKDAPERGPQFKAMNEMLDALIQQNARLSADSLLSLAESFPAQSAILVTRLEEPDRLRVLSSWYLHRGDPNKQVLSRIAAMMLVKNPPAGLAGTVVNEAELHLLVTIHNPGAPSWGPGEGGSYFGGLESLPEAGWPPIFTYQLAEKTSSDNDPILAEAGGARIFYHRSKSGGHSCQAVRPLGAKTRHELIAEMLGVSPDQVGWKVESLQDVSFEGGTDFRETMQQSVSNEEAKLDQTVKSLAQSGALTEDEAQKYRPRLVVRHCT